MKDFWKGTLIESIMEEATDRPLDPACVIKLGETIEGVMSFTERSIYTYARKLKESADHIIVNSKFHPITREMEIQHGSLEIKYAFIMDLMWNLIRDRLNLWGENIGVRSHFTIVTFKENEPIIKSLEKIKEIFQEHMGAKHKSTDIH